MTAKVSLELLGVPEVKVDGSTIENIPFADLRMLAALALAAGPISRRELSRDVLFISPSTLETRLSRLRSTLGLSRPLHRVARPRSSLIVLDREVVGTDVDAYDGFLNEAFALGSGRPGADTLDAVLAADDLWRGEPAVALDLEVADRTAVGRQLQRLRNQRAQACELAADLMAQLDRIEPVRIERWLSETADLPNCWFAKARVVTELHGPAKGQEVLDRWDEAVARSNGEPTRSHHDQRAWAERFVRGFVRTPSFPIPADHRLITVAGREREFDQLRTFVEGLSEESGVCLLTGPGGSGKSHLLSALSQHLSSTPIVTMLAGDVERRGSAHSALFNALGPQWALAQRIPVPPRETVFSATLLDLLVNSSLLSRDRATEAVLVPMSGERHTTEEIADPSESEPLQRIGLLVNELLSISANGRTTVLVLDNVHRAAPGFDGILTGIVEALPPKGVGLLIAYRGDELSADSWLRARVDGDQIGNCHVRVTTLKPFTSDEAHRFLAATRSAEDFDRTLASVEGDMSMRLPLTLLHLNATSGGQPAGARSGTRPADDGIAMKIRSLPAPSRLALTAAATTTYGVGIDTAVVCACIDHVGMPDQELEHLFAPAVAIGLVERVDYGWQFTHRRIQELVMHDADPQLERYLHRRALEHRLANAEQFGWSSESAAMLVQHARGSDTVSQRGAVLHSLVVTGDALLGRLELGAATDALTCALELCRSEDAEAADVLLRRALVRRLSGEWVEAEADLTQCWEIARAIGDLRLEGLATVAMAHVTWDPAQFGASLEVRLRSLLERLPASEVLWRARVGACLAGGLYQDGASGAGDDGASLALEALNHVDRFPDPPIRAEMLTWIRKGLLDVIPPEQSLELAVRLEAASGTSRYHRGNALLAQLVDLARSGDDARARTMAERYLELASETKSGVHGFISEVLRAFWAIADGEFEVARSAVERASVRGPSFGGTTAAQILGGQNLWIARETGLFTANPELVPMIERRFPPDGRLPMWATTAAWLRAEIGDIDNAAKMLLDVEDRVGRFDQLRPGPLRIAVLALAAETLAQIHSSTGPDSPEAMRLVGMAAAVVSALRAHPDTNVIVGWPTLHLGPTSRFLGLGLAAAGELEEANEVLSGARDAVSAFPPLQSRLEREISSVGQRDRGQ